jgi:hypothetical protein
MERVGVAPDCPWPSGISMMEVHLMPWALKADFRMCRRDLIASGQLGVSLKTKANCLRWPSCPEEG